jgi:hypothetical protein
MGSLCPPSSWTVSQTLIEAVDGWLTAIQAIQFSASDSGESFGTVRRDPGAANLPAFSVGRRMLADGLEMADALRHRGIDVTLMGRSEAVLPTVDTAFGQVIETELRAHGAALELRDGF